MLTDVTDRMIKFRQENGREPTAVTITQDEYRGICCELAVSHPHQAVTQTIAGIPFTVVPNDKKPECI